MIAYRKTSGPFSPLLRRERFASGLKYYVDDHFRRREKRGVIDRVNSDLRCHPLCHEVLRLWVDHAIFFRNQEPGGFRSPRGFRCWLLNATDRSWPLHGGGNCLHIVRSILGEGVLEAFLRHPDETVSVGLQMRSLRMRFLTVEYLSYCLTLVGSESSNIH